MRAFCTVSAPLEVCASSAEQLSPGSRFLALRLLGNQQPKTLYFLVDAKSRVREVYTQTCLHFAEQGMLDTELFGLAVLIDGEYMFADPESKLSKYGPKSWRSSHTHGLDANGRPLLELHFRVQFYIENPLMLKDETTRHYYYLQLKYNALNREIPKEFNEQSMILLAGLALQADLGDAPAAATSSTSTKSTNSLKSKKSINSIATGVPAIAGATAIVAKSDIINKSKDLSSSSDDSNGGIGAGIGYGSDKVAIVKNDGSKLSLYKNKTITTTTTSTGMTFSNKHSVVPASTTSTLIMSSTTTLPKISKRMNSTNDRALRLSTYIGSTSQAVNSKTTTSAITTTASGVSATGAVTTASGTATTSMVTSTLSSGIGINDKNTHSVKVSSSSSSGLGAAIGTAYPEYFRLDDYLPLILRNSWAESALRACHLENRGMSKSDAELRYIQQACVSNESLNAHTFHMRMSKHELGPGNSWFVVYAKGIKIFSAAEGAQQQITFLWPNITKLSFERKKFEIRSGENKITLYSTTDDKNKMLLTLCKETHQFSMKLAARLKEVIKREEEESNSLHASYIYSRSLHLPYKNKSDQRISVISSTSSNTTSGIVSDRVHSEDELEIMINSPPAPIAAPSTESLALAHLLDHPSVSRQTSSVGQVSRKELEEQLAALSVRQTQKHALIKAGKDSPTELSNSSSVGTSSNSGSIPTTSPRNMDSSNATDSPGSQHNIGSQCSSTCSTVVVTSTVDVSNGNVLNDLPVHSNDVPHRRNSTSSSLELGFSHTAQNSTISEAESTCVPHDFIPTNLGETESVSGVYTLAHGAPPTETSGVYTMHSSEMTGQSSEIAESEKSSHYGMFQPAKSEISDDHLREDEPNLDSVDGNDKFCNKRIKNEDFRLRCDSNVSTSGSFRGDGSDPTDKKHTLLSAEELTDLIVGRGTYPNRKTVSSTLDSDCDYVTLPLPMEGDSYIQGHQDTAPSEDHVDDLINDLLPIDPPAPPQRVDSNRPTLTNLCNIPPPPPYHGRHEKTGLCGPPVRSSLPAKPLPISMPIPIPLPIPIPPVTSTISNPIKNSSPKVPSKSAKLEAKPLQQKLSSCKKIQQKSIPLLPMPPVTAPTTIRRRDPPPYPCSSKPRPTSLISVSSATTTSSSALQAALSSTGGSMTSLKSEEHTARFITTKPQINILKAHTSLVNETPKPSYAAPTNCSSAASSTGSICSHQLSQHSVPNSNYAGGSQTSLSLSHHPTLSASATVVAHATAGVIPSTIGIPIVPYSIHSAHKSMSSLHQQPPPPPPYPETRTCVLLPVIKPRQFLPPPPPSLPRQPPPPPPPQIAGIYTSPLAHKQLELYQQQLCSDVDYVIYPIQDPAVSQQEYLDAKQGSILAAMAQTPPPHPYLAYQAHPASWDTCKGHAIYRSTPYLPLALSTHSRYASTQNLSDTYVQLPSAYSSLYSPSMASLCSSYEPPPPPPLHPASLAVAAAASASPANTSNLFARSRSDDNILNTLDSLPKAKRMPPPPPPPYVNRRLKKPPMPTPSEKPPPIPSKPSSSSCLSSQNQLTNTQNASKVPMSQLPPRKPPSLGISGRTAGTHMTKTSSGAQWIGERPKPNMGISRGSSSILAHLQASVAAANLQAAKASAVNSKANSGATHHSSSSKVKSFGTNTGSSCSSSTPPNPLDIALLREKSKNLDLPLISALCNDRSLLKQTKVLVNPKNMRSTTNLTNGSGTLINNALPTSTSTTNFNNSSNSLSSSITNTISLNTGNNYHTSSKSLAVASNNLNGFTTSSPSQALSSTMSNSLNSTAGNGMKSSSPISPTTGITVPSTASATKSRKTSLHRHPNDKLPPLPMQLAEANNYVMDPAILKHHKNFNS